MSKMFAFQCHLYGSIRRQQPLSCLSFLLSNSPFISMPWFAVKEGSQAEGRQMEDKRLL